MILKFFKQVILTTSLIFGLCFSSNACDLLVATVVSNINLGNGTYQLTIQYCEEISNGGTTEVSGILLDVVGANILSTNTPSFTSSSTGVTINYNVIDANTVQWGEWDDNPNVSPFMDDGDPQQCLTIVVITDGPATSVGVAGSSANVDEGAGFTTHMGRRTCRDVVTVPAPCTPVTPTFNPMPDRCLNSGTATGLPTTSTNGINGTWSPGTINTTTAGVRTFTFTPSGGCNPQVTLTITVVAPTVPTFNPIGPVCQNAAVVLPTTSTNGLNGTWAPVVNTSAVGTINYTFTTSGGGCVSSAVLPLTVSASITPTFTAVAPICSGAALAPLPTTSNNGVTGTWSPAINNTATTPYTFTPTVGGCATPTNLTVTVNPNVTPTFTPIANICQNAAAPALPVTSTNGITGTWSPAIINTTTAGTTTYTFTPNAGQCSSPTTLNVTINAQTTPTFAAIAPVCQNAAVVLPITSTNGINGTWSPAVNTSAVGTINYTFTPTAGQCATTTTLGITVLASVTPTFTPIPSVCPNDVVVLPTTSNNGINGTWAPAVNTSAVGTINYTFTPSGGTCPLTAVLPITVNNSGNPTFNPIASVCVGAPAPVLPTTSTNGINGTWSGAVSTATAGTFNFTFTPSAASCSNTASISVTINPLPTVGAGIDQTVCAGDLVTLNGSGATSYTWNNGITNNVAFAPPVGVTTTYTVTGTDANGCVNTDDVLVTVVNVPVVNAGADQTICLGQSVTLTASGATTYVWDNGGANGQSVSPLGTTTYTVVGTAGSCTDDDDITITVNNPITPTFNPIASVCVGAPAPVLPTTSTNGINGTWSGTVSTVTAGTFNFTFTATPPSCTNTAPISVTINPLPTVGAGIDQTVCDGDLVTLSGSGTATGYVWNNGITNNVAFVPPVGVATTYTVTGTDGNGCQNTDDVIVTSANIPVVNAGVDQTICLGENAVLTASGATTYVWDNGGANGQSVSPLATTTYTVIGTAGSCTDDDDITITVNNPITPIFNPITSVCVGAPAPVLPTTSTNGINGTWSAAVSTATAGTYNFTFTPTTWCATSTSISVTINPLPTVNAGIDQTVCEGDLVTLTGSGTATGYAWNNGITNNVAFVPPVGVTTTYTVTGTDGNGCVNTDNVLVTVVLNPIVNAGVDQTICIGESVILTASGATTYVWSNGGSNGQSVAPTTTTTYSVVGTAGSCFDSDDITVIVNPLPLVQFTPDVTTGCSPLDVNFTVQSAPGVSCVWNFGDGTSVTGCGTASHTYTGVGCYNVTMTTTDVNGCVGTRTYNNLICLVDYPVAEFAANPSELSTLDGITTMVNTSQGAVTYSWDFGDGSAGSSAFEPTHTFPYYDPGSYTIMLIVENAAGCPDTAYQTIRVVEEVIFYVPNTFTPDGDSYNQDFKPVFTSGFDPYDYTLLIFNRWGEIVFESHDTTIGWNGLYAGSHIVQDGTYTWKIEFKQSMNDKRRTEIGHVTLIR